MKYSEASLGRVFTVKFDDGEDLIKNIDTFLSESGINSCMFFLIGALRSGEIVTGPKIDIIPPDPGWHLFDKAYEVVAIGTVYPAEGKPKLHIHGSFGRGNDTITGCLRNTAKVFLVTEAIFFELHTTAERIYDKYSEHFLLDPSPKKNNKDSMI